MKVGLFDSGIGGLSVAKSIYEAKIFEEIVYYGDTARVPYGSKDKNTIIRYALEAVEFFKNFDIDILIVACNTVSSYALKEMQEIAPFRVIGVIEPGIEAVTKKTTSKENILVIGTKATIEANLYATSLQKLGYENIISKATPLFVPIVEENLSDTRILQITIEYYFQNLPIPDVVVLGCTHYPLIENSLKQYYPNAKFVHSGDAIVDYLAKEGIIKLYDKTNFKIFASENPDRIKQIAKDWIGLS